jgi:hypothetical protein
MNSSSHVSWTYVYCTTYMTLHYTHKNYNQAITDTTPCQGPIPVLQKHTECFFQPVICRASDSFEQFSAGHFCQCRLQAFSQVWLRLAILMEFQNNLTEPFNWQISLRLHYIGWLSVTADLVGSLSHTPIATSSLHLSFRHRAFY